MSLSPEEKRKKWRDALELAGEKLIESKAHGGFAKICNKCGAGMIPCKCYTNSPQESLDSDTGTLNSEDTSINGGLKE